MLFEFLGVCGGYEQRVKFRGETEAEAKLAAIEWFGHDRIECVARWSVID